MLQRTPLYEEHLKLKAKIVEFGGWEMPVLYTNLIEEHNAVRNKVGMFDAGHMGVVKINNSDELIASQDKLLTRKIDNIPQGKIRYNRILNEEKGVVDDILVYKDFEHYLAVFNASNTLKDINYLKTKGIDCEMMGLHIIALQGPEADALIQKYNEEELDKLVPYYGFISTTLADFDVILSRTGYTGERGFEIMATPEDSPKIWAMLLQDGVTPCGLGARDTLRIEAGMPLYGHEMKDEWTSEKSESIIGLKLLERGVPRQGYPVLSEAGKVIGEITSGTFSPTLKEPIAMALAEGKQPGDIVFVQIRDNKVKALLVKLPFVHKIKK